MSIFRKEELSRGLILIFSSLNAHANVNYILKCGKVGEFCKNKEAKTDLVDMLRRLADNIEKNY